MSLYIVDIHGDIEGDYEIVRKYEEPESKWIPTSERLPEPYGHVLRTVKSIGWNGTFSIYVDIGTVCPIDTDVIAWMPLPVPMIPEPYREEIEIHCNCTDAEIAKSFIEDVEAVKELLPQAEREVSE